MMAFLALPLPLAAAVAACGSPSPQPSPKASSAAILGSAVRQDCTAVSDVLADGPDPDADPAGYAQAQVLPLRQLTIADAALHRDVLALANAFQVLSASAGKTAAANVAKAEKAVNSICPEAAP